MGSPSFLCVSKTVKLFLPAFRILVSPASPLLSHNHTMTDPKIREKGKDFVLITETYKWVALFYEISTFLILLKLHLQLPRVPH